MTKHFEDFRNFIYTQYFSDGIKVTMGVLLPSLLFYQFDQLNTGIAISLGALCVSIADSPGPWLHRKNGMLFTNIAIFITALITGFFNQFESLLVLEIFLLCFLFGMLNVYGSRAASVGTAALLIMILNLSPFKNSEAIYIHALLILGGGIWYFLLSQSFSKLRPYRYAQQTLGECIGEIAKYLKLRSDFYRVEISVESVFENLLAQQVKVNEMLDHSRDALFRTRKLLNESSNATRLMIAIFVDMVDIFEDTMATQNDYQLIRTKYAEHHVLPQFAMVIDKLADHINYLGYCLLHQEKPAKDHFTIKDLDNLKKHIDLLETKGEQVFILKRILINLRTIFNKTEAILEYFESKTQPSAKNASKLDLSRFVNHEKLSWNAILDNLHLKSSAFRFSIRLAVVSVIGFLIGKLFEFGDHSYWILLTILVIMKPSYSSTRQRYYERVWGTLVGGIIGGVILMFVHDERILFVLLLVFMLITYSFIRIKYLVGVIFMTPFILIMFSFINQTTNSPTGIAGERIIDTIVGSILAIIFSYVILPDWESAQIKKYLIQTVKANLNYFEHIILRYTLLPVTETDYKLARKQVYLHTANLAAAFQRAMDEPKHKQKNIREIHKFVVLNHILSSYLANLSAYCKEKTLSVDSRQLKLIRKTRFYLEETLQKLNQEQSFSENKLHIHLSTQEPDEQAVEQLERINDLSQDISKIADKLSA